MRATRYQLLAAVTLLVVGGCAPSDLNGRSVTSEPPPNIETQQVSIQSRDVDSYRIETEAVVESNRDFESTTLTLNLTKQTNSVARSMGVTIRFGEVICNSRRPYLVTGARFAGEKGHHELSCRPFTPATEFVGLPEGEVQ